MPELPEVEVTRRQIAPRIRGRRIAAVETTRPSYVFLTPPPVLKRRLAGRRVEGVERIGKYLLLDLDDGSRLLLHLGMTGQLFVPGRGGVALFSAERGGSLAPVEQGRGFRSDAHTHLRLRFEDGGPDLVFRDVRKFGKIQWLALGGSSRRLEVLGVDALAAGPEVLLQASRRRRTPLKTLLLDQSVLAGVGNIYADEALFLARIRPTRRASRLSGAEARRLLAAVQRVLRESIAKGADDLVTRVYGRRGEPCVRCRTPIVRRVLAGRSSHYCPRCQV